MASDGKVYPDALAAALADGASIDWQAVADAGDGAGNADLIRQLRVIEAMRPRSDASTSTAARPWAWRLVFGVAMVATAFAAVKVVLALVGVPELLGREPVPRGAVPFALNLIIFGVGGLLLVGGSDRDRRLRLLGGLYLTTAAAFVQPFLGRTGGAAGMLMDALRAVTPEAFIPLCVWLFAWTFPREPLGRRARWLAGLMIAAAGLVATVFVAANVAATQRLWPVTDAGWTSWLHGVDRNAPRSFYWPTLFAIALPALPFLVAKARLETPERRRKVRWFLGALAFGFAPVLLAAIATPFVPALKDPDVRRRVGLGLYAALATIVPMTAYAVTGNRVMDLEFVVRATLKYALAKYAILAAIVGPLTYVALDIFVNRGLTFVQYLDDRQPGSPLALSLLGLLALAFRSHLVGAVDRWFMREPLDAPLALARFEHRVRASEHLHEICAGLGEELARALHAVRVCVLLRSESGDALVALDDAAPDLPADSMLLGLLAHTRRELSITGMARLVRLLPEPDQDWLHETGAQMLAPLVDSSGRVLGVVALGEAANQLPYTPVHVALVTAMCGQAAMQLENRWLRETQGEAARASQAPSSGVSWQDEPAACCPNCTELSRPGTHRCRCGTITTPAVLPLFVNAKFTLQRVLGAGGTGVVYLATDMSLGRKVAIKTLPPMRREYAERLRREARAMATVRHPNLATIYGAEEWHDTPLLVVEYLEGGTLHDVLARGPLPVDEGLDLGIMLADVLDRVHGSGVLHRDIKPSNIGYTADGVPKLLDFGLAAMLDRSHGSEAPPVLLPADPEALATRFHGVLASSTLTITHQVVGTPLYLSPEALDGAPAHESFDLWSLGLVLYEAIAGRHPLAGRSVPEVVQAVRHTPLPDIRVLRPDVPAPVAVFLADALSPAIDRRPASAAHLRTALRELRARLTPDS